jgi:hypothetical protein
MMKVVVPWVAIVAWVGGCDSTTVEKTAQASVSSMTLEECVGMFAAEVHAHCTDNGPAPSGRGTAPSEEGFVGNKDDDPFGQKAPSFEVEPPAPSPAVDSHCSASALAAATAAREGSFRSCLSKRSDVAEPCSAALAVACPPGLAEDECAGARSAAVAFCQAESTAL